MQNLTGALDSAFPSPCWRSPWHTSSPSPQTPSFHLQTEPQQAAGLPLVLEAAEQVRRSCFTAGATWGALPNSSHLRKAPQHFALLSLHTHPLTSGILLCKPHFTEGSLCPLSVLGSTKGNHTLTLCYNFTGSVWIILRKL